MCTCTLYTYIGMFKQHCSMIIRDLMLQHFSSNSFTRKCCVSIAKSYLNEKHIGKIDSDICNKM